MLPAGLRPFGRLARWDRPIGIWLLLFPGWWSVSFAAALASSGDVARYGLLMVLFALGAIAMRGAGCTWNDILDRDIDAQVERTRNRPLPAGEVSLRQAAAWLVLQSLIGAAVLASFNGFAIAVGLASLLLVAVYPLMKRITFWPQSVLGLAFNWGALLGWAAASGGLGLAALLLYAGGVAWTLVYDTIYAMQDRRDDSVIGVRSTARRFERQPIAWLTGFAFLTVIGFGLAGWVGGLGWPYFIAVALVGLHLGWQIVTLQPQQPADCLAKFRANRQIGWILLAGILAARLGP